MGSAKNKQNKKRYSKKQTVTKRNVKRNLPEKQIIQAHILRPETNQRYWISIQPTFPPDDSRSSIPKSAIGSSGCYEATFFLSIPGKEHFRDEINIDQILQSGNSLLIMPPSISKIRVPVLNEQEQVEVLFSANNRRLLSSATIKISASSFKDAEIRAYDLIMPILSWWSYKYDVALDISAYRVVEEKTQVQNWAFNIVGAAKELDFNVAAVSKPEYSTLFASYREATNATNTFYRFLCYFKVIEGVKYLRKQRKHAALAAGETYKEPPDEKIPVTIEELNALNIYMADHFQPYLGKKFTWVIDQLRYVLRNAIAHLEPSADSLIADKYEDIMKCEQVMPIIKYISRVVLRNEIRADKDLANTNISKDSFLS